MQPMKTWMLTASLFLLLGGCSLLGDETPAALDPLVATLWRFESVGLGDQQTPPPPGADYTVYTLQFIGEGRFRVQIDCNEGFGEYHVSGPGKIDLDLQFITLAGCPNTRYNEHYDRWLAEIHRFDLHEPGRLRLYTKSGFVLRFVPVLPR